MRTVISRLLVFFCIWSIEAEDKGAVKREIPKFQAYVRLIVSGDETIKDEVTSFISRELRQLGDVTITRDEPPAESFIRVWTISIIAADNKIQNGTTIGYSLSAVVLESRSWGKVIAGISLPKEGRQWLQEHSELDNHILHSGKDLKKICEGLVA